METKEYTVTDQAGPKVAGRAVEVGAKISLSEPEARAELLAGAIVPAGTKPQPAEAVRNPRKLADTQARARGADSAKAEATEGESPAPAADPAAQA